MTTKFFARFVCLILISVGYRYEHFSNCTLCSTTWLQMYVPNEQDNNVCAVIFENKVYVKSPRDDVLQQKIRNGKRFHGTGQDAKLFDTQNDRLYSNQLDWEVKLVYLNIK